MSEQQPRKLLRCTIKEEYVELTGDAVSAALLNQMIFWQEVINKSDSEKLAEIEVLERIGDHDKANKMRSQLRGGWFWKSAQELSDEIMFSTRPTVARKLKALVDNGIIESRKNDKKKFDHTNHYRVNLSFIQRELDKLGFSLEGYTLSRPSQNEDLPIAQNEQSKETPKVPIAQNEQSKVHYEQSAAYNEQSATHSEQSISRFTSLGLLSLEFEEEEVYTGRDPLIHMLINVSQTKAPTIRHEAFLQNLTMYNIKNEMGLQVVEYMKTQQQDINNYTCDAIDRTFAEFVKRSKTNDKVKVFPRWFATTIANKQFEVDQDDARADEARREEERFQRRLERYKNSSHQLAAATSEMH
ncbi:hypothetical protein MHH92_30425 [Paenibacillus sp. FSL M7-1414]|uniref:hypothetical protein n=1 Tax=Paenibacillus sp. FSL M7-1414 TaxID=2921542 RepID=UPI0030FC1AF7